MTKLGDSPTTKKTIHELAKEHPDKNYRELEKYRDADRQEEEKSIPLTEDQKGVCITAALKKDRGYPDLTEVLATENDKLKKEIKNLKWIKNHDYIFLIDENKKLHAEIKKLKEGTVDKARKAGL